ncbi:hypothetical protein NESM_000159200 [Novymonas esmeraldas]|uniref:Uncharacterized protein n=1 Tax=Novymonas esmeraldas TaxID=1808958 RepID=A0AAW0F410_9TRYP
MSRTSSTYVSPNLGPTAPWGQQTSTGVFRPPPTMSLNPGPTDMPLRHEGRPAPPSYPASCGSGDVGGDHRLVQGIAPTPPYALGGSLPHSRTGEVRGRMAPSPPMRPASPPSYSHNHYTNAPAAFTLGGSHNVTGAGNGDGASGTSVYPADRIMKMISYSVHREEDAFLAKKESNRVLEKELLHAQGQRRETQRQLEAVDETLQMLQGIREAQSKLGASFGLSL